MQPADQIEYHSRRSSLELDLGLRASSIVAAKAHLELSTLHLRRAQALGEPSNRKPPCIM